MTFRHRVALKTSLLLAVVGIVAGAALAAAAAPAQEQLGAVSFDVTTSSAAARENFIAGLAALHSFFYEEALGYFEQAVVADPDFAMGYWGVAHTYNHPLWRQQEAAPARVALAKIGNVNHLRAEEVGLIGALRLLYDENVDDKLARDTAYSLALQAMHAEFPDNHEISVFYGLSILGTVRPGDDRGSRVKRQMLAGRIALDVYGENPDHPGAAHYVIHSFDDPEHAILALPAAFRYAEIAPAAHHARHMPSHIFLQLGMWREAAASNESSYGSSYDWVERDGLDTGLRDWHSYTWLNYIYLQQGRFADSSELIADALRDATANPGSRIPGTYRGLVAAHTIESEDWDTIELLTELPGDDAYSGGNNLLLARSFAAAGRRDFAAATGIVERLRANARRLAERDQPYQAATAELYALLAAGQLEAAQDNLDTAIELLAKATHIEEGQAPPSGPPGPMKPSHELLGEVLLQAGQPERALEQFDIALFRQTNRGRSLLGVARAHAAMGHPNVAAGAYRKFLESWGPADGDRPEIGEAESYVRRLSQQ